MITVHVCSQEPTTRRPFSLVQLADLDALAAKAGAKVKGSLVKSYQEGQAKYRERREMRYVARESACSAFPIVQSDEKHTFRWQQWW